MKKQVINLLAADILVKIHFTNLNFDKVSIQSFTEEQLTDILRSLPLPSQKQLDEGYKPNYVDDLEYIKTLIAALQVGYSQENILDLENHYWKGYIATQLVVNCNWLPYVAGRLEKYLTNKHAKDYDKMRELCAEYDKEDFDAFDCYIIECLRDGHITLGQALFKAMPEGFQHDFLCGIHENEIDDTITQYLR